MAKVRYVGPHDAVEIAALGVVVQRGKSVDVPAPVAKDLLTQPDNFQPARPPAKKAAGRKPQQPVTADDKEA